MGLQVSVKILRILQTTQDLNFMKIYVDKMTISLLERKVFEVSRQAFNLLKGAHQRRCIKTAVLKSLAIFTGKHLL